MISNKCGNSSSEIVLLSKMNLWLLHVWTSGWSLLQKMLLLAEEYSVLFLVIAVRGNTTISELTVLEGVHQPLQVGARWLGARADGHGLAVKVVGWWAGLEDVGSHVLWGKQERSLNITIARVQSLSVHMLEHDMQRVAERDQHPRRSQQ